MSINKARVVLISMYDTFNILPLHFDTRLRLSLVNFPTIPMLMTTPFDFVFVVSLLFSNSSMRDYQSLVRLYT